MQRELLPILTFDFIQRARFRARYDLSYVVILMACVGH
jgi:hypothetical protein